MAIKSRPTSAVQEPPAAVASMNPDNMTSGLKDDFDGEVLKARLIPWDYDGKIDHHILAVALTIKPDDEKEPFVQPYSCGELDNFVPSMDGRVSVDLENGEGEALEGIYALKVGKKEQLNNSTNWAHFIGALLDAGFDKGKLAAAVTFVEGVYGHWNRIPQKKRSGIVVQPVEGGRTRTSDILVITELKEKAAGAKAAKSAKAAPAVAVPTAGDLDSRLEAVVAEAVKKAGDDGLAKAKLAGIAIKAFTGPEKGKAVKRVSEAEFLEGSDQWAFDGDSGTLIAV